MKKVILIKIFIGVFLLMSNISEAGITKEERAKFDYHLKRIENSQKSYHARKEAQRQKDIQRAKQNREKAERRKQLQNVAKRNTALAREKMIRDTNERVRNLRAGQCTVNELTGNMICK